MISPKITYTEATLKRLTGFGHEREKENNNERKRGHKFERVWRKVSELLRGKGWRKKGGKWYIIF